MSAKGVYTVLEQGSKLTAQGRQWFGKISAQRRADPLLQYIYQARDDDEHGVNFVIKHDKTTARIKFRIGESPELHDLVVRSDPDFPGTTEDSEITINSLNGAAISQEHRIPVFRLLKVHGRGNIIYSPPKTHLGQEVDTDLPVPVGKLCVAYLDKVVEEAALLA